MRLLPLAVPALLLFLAAPATARVTEKLEYTKKQAFNAAVRFVRVDNRYNVTEKDEDNGYLLFEYRAPGTEGVKQASVEVIEGESGALLIVQIPEMPEYHEQHVADGLVSKLRADYGEPPKRESKPENKPEKKPEKAKPDDQPDDDNGQDDDDSYEEMPIEPVKRYRIKDK